MKKQKEAVLLVLLSVVCVLGICLCVYLTSRLNGDTEDAQNFVVDEKTDDKSTQDNPAGIAPLDETSKMLLAENGWEESFLYKNNWINNPDGTVTFDGERYKRKAHVKAILCAGIDKDKSTQGISADDPGNADGIILAAHDTSDNSVKVIMIPRDTMVDCVVTGPDGNKYTAFDHLNVSFRLGDGGKTSAESLKNTTSTLLCDTEIDHYLVGDLSLLADVNDMVGGVEVTIPNDNLKNVNPEWVEGKKVILKGDEAEKFIRYRDVNTDGSPVVRMSQHEQYIAGFYDALKKKMRSDSGIVSKLADKIDATVVSDMSKGEYEKLAVDAVLSDFDLDDIYTLPGTMVIEETDGEWYDEVFTDYTEAIPMILDLFYRKVE